MSPIAVLVISCLVIGSQAGTTTTHEPSEVEHIAYKYNYHTQHLVIRIFDNKSGECYVVTLNDNDKAQVHTDAGMSALELRAMGMLSSGVSVTKDTLNAVDVKWCDPPHGHRNFTYFTLTGV